MSDLTPDPDDPYGLKRFLDELDTDGFGITYETVATALAQYQEIVNLLPDPDKIWHSLTPFEEQLIECVTDDHLRKNLALELLSIDGPEPHTTDLDSIPDTAIVYVEYRYLHSIMRHLIRHAMVANKFISPRFTPHE